MKLGFHFVPSQPTALGMTQTAYTAQERGVSYMTGKPVRDSLALRLACAAVEAGIKPVS